jgi:hypothetical protein
MIDRMFPFAEAKAAYCHFEGRGHFGKVVITHVTADEYPTSA